jgi:hypothetical protein
VLLREYDLSADLPLLDQDILEVELPGEFLISVGWFPQYDPHGNFRLAVFQRNKPGHLHCVEVKTPLEVAAALSDLASQYSPKRPLSLVPRTS